MGSSRITPSQYNRLSEADRLSFSHRSEEPLERPESLLGLALDMCRWNDPELLPVVENLEKSCHFFGVSMSGLLLKESNGEDVPLVALMKKKDNKIFRILHRNIENGWPIPDRIQRTEEFLVMRADSSAHFWGFQIFGKGCTYVGDLPNGIRDGKGRIEYASNWSYEGDFMDNNKHGVGNEYIGGPKPKQHFGIFVDNQYQGNPWAERPAPKKPRIRYLKEFFS